MIINSECKELLMVVEQSKDGIIPVNARELYLLENIFKTYGIKDILKETSILALIWNDDVKPGKKIFFKDYYRTFYQFIKEINYKKVVIFSNLFDKMYDGTALNLYLPEEINKRNKEVKYQVNCLVLPTIDKIMKDEKRDKSGIKWEVYQKLNNYMK